MKLGAVMYRKCVCTNDLFEGQIFMQTPIGTTMPLSPLIADCQIRGTSVPSSSRSQNGSIGQVTGVTGVTGLSLNGR